MVLVLPAVDRNKSFWEKLGSGLSEGLQEGLKLYGENEKKKQLTQALEDVKGVYGNPDLDEQQPLFTVFFLTLLITLIVSLAAFNPSFIINILLIMINN